MARVPRSSLPDGCFHVFSRGIASPLPLFRDDDDRALFVELVWETSRRHHWTIHALCVLGTHYHLVVESTRTDLSAGMQRLNWSYARAVNARAGAFGHAFAGRFGARCVAADDYLYDVCAYVLLNPVRARLCDRADEWPWSYCSFGRT